MTRLPTVGIVISALLILAILLAGCAGQQNAANSPPATPATNPGPGGARVAPPDITALTAVPSPLPPVYSAAQLPDISRIHLGFQNIPNGTLNQIEVTDIDYLKEMQKLDSDYYAVIAAQYPRAPILSNLAISSSTLANADYVIYVRYSITDPESDIQGIFSDPKLQQIYNQDLATAAGGLGDAYTAAAQDEDLHIANLVAAMSRTNNQDLIFMYSQQLAEARNNLRQVTQQLRTMGIQYTPVYLPSDSYNAIIYSDMESVRVP
jgi:hypothetical protein